MYNIEKTDQAEVVAVVYAYEDAVKAFIKACPDFPGGMELASECGKAAANLESELHHNIGIRGLTLPNRGKLEA